MNSNKYNSLNHRTLPYVREDLSWVFGKDDWDQNNNGYIETFRYGINRELGIGNRRQYSVVFAESGNMSPQNIVRLNMLAFIVTYHAPFVYQMKYHGRQMIDSGQFTIAQIDSILENLGNADLGGAYSNVTATTNSDGVRVTIVAVNLRQGKLNERIELDDTGRLTVKDTLKNFQRLPKVYKRNRRSLT